MGIIRLDASAPKGSRRRKALDEEAAFTKRPSHTAQPWAAPSHRPLPIKWAFSPGGDSSLGVALTAVQIAFLDRLTCFPKTGPRMTGKF
jgi:hypothetical protein